MNTRLKLKVKYILCETYYKTIIVPVTLWPTHTSVFWGISCNVHAGIKLICVTCCLYLLLNKNWMRETCFQKSLSQHVVLLSVPPCSWEWLQHCLLPQWKAEWLAAESSKVVPGSGPAGLLCCCLCWLARVSQCCSARLLTDPLPKLRPWCSASAHWLAPKDRLCITSCTVDDAWYCVVYLYVTLWSEYKQ